MIDESNRLAQARALLRNNAPRDALEVLDGMRRDHPHGALAQERQILTIEGLGSLGDAAAAAVAARDFLERYPTSPHVGSARRALQSASPPLPLADP
jgi:outer membrane protein assembly factor BamD (BamD/ComL family)